MNMARYHSTPSGDIDFVTDETLMSPTITRSDVHLRLGGSAIVWMVGWWDGRREGLGRNKRKHKAISGHFWCRFGSRSTLATPRNDEVMDRETRGSDKARQSDLGLVLLRVRVLGALCDTVEWWSDGPPNVTCTCRECLTATRTVRGEHAKAGCTFKSGEWKGFTVESGEGKQSRKSLAEGSVAVKHTAGVW